MSHPYSITVRAAAVLHKANLEFVCFSEHRKQKAYKKILIVLTDMPERFSFSSPLINFKASFRSQSGDWVLIGRRQSSSAGQPVAHILNLKLWVSEDTDTKSVWNVCSLHSPVKVLLFWLSRVQPSLIAYKLVFQFICINQLTDDPCPPLWHDSSFNLGVLSLQ